MVEGRANLAVTAEALAFRGLVGDLRDISRILADLLMHSVVMVAHNEPYVAIIAHKSLAVLGQLIDATRATQEVPACCKKSLELRATKSLGSRVMLRLQASGSGTAFWLTSRTSLRLWDSILADKSVTIVRWTGASIGHRTRQKPPWVSSMCMFH